MSTIPVPEWSFLLARSSDLSIVAPVSAATVRSLSMFWNKPGSMSITAPIDSELAIKARSLATCLIASVKIYNDDGTSFTTVPWSGPIFNINSDADGQNDVTQITALGWFEELNRRFLDAQLPPSSKAGGLIALDLLDAANAKVDSLSRPQPTHVVAGTQTDTQVRERTYQRGQKIGDAISELAEVENGYDFSVDPMTRALSFHAPTEFTDRPKVHFGYNLAPGNLAKVSEAEDGGKTRNRISVEGPGGVAIQDDTEAIDTVGIMMEDYISISDAPDLDILNAYAAAELAFSGLPEKVLTLVPKSPAPGVHVPTFLRDFQLGDRIYFSCDRGRLQYRKQPVRAFGVTLSFDSNGNQNVDSFDINYS